jgi:hypothetical protein
MNRRDALSIPGRTGMMARAECVVQEELALEATLKRLREMSRPGALGCLRQTAQLRLCLSWLADWPGSPEAPDRPEPTDEEIIAEYHRLRELYPDGTPCRELEPGAAGRAECCAVDVA